MNFLIVYSCPIGLISFESSRACDASRRGDELYVLQLTEFAWCTGLALLRETIVADTPARKMATFEAGNSVFFCL